MNLANAFWIFTNANPADFANAAKSTGCVEAGTGIEPVFTDLQSVSESGPKILCHSENSADSCFCKHPGQSENEPKTLQTGADRCEGCVVVWIVLCAALTVFCIGTAIAGWWM